MASEDMLRSRTSIRETPVEEVVLDNARPVKNLVNGQSLKQREQKSLKATLSAVPGLGSSRILVDVMGMFMLIWPLLFVWYVLFSMHYFGGSLSAAWSAIRREYGKGELYEYIRKRSPGALPEGLALYACWVALQIILYLTVPGQRAFGQPTPSGRVLEYNCNGLNCWIVTHVLVIACVKFGLFRGTLLYDNWLSLFFITNICGLLLTAFAYWKANKDPSHIDDRRFSGSIFYDLFMGIEHNPRIGKFDFKLFFNGRPGICAWTLINLTCAAKQYEKFGYITNSMVIINVLHAMYVLDFFYHESWYLRTMDMAHDHFGFYLAWGDLVWLPFTYTLQAFYLVQNPNDLSNLQAAAIMLLGLAGYTIFRLANNQKDTFRKEMAEFGDSVIWGKPASYIPAVFKTTSGEIRHSPLLTSGWWGISRHFNYVGDLMGCLAYSLVCGTSHLLPWFYFIYMIILLTHRIYRDHVRCKEKYGSFWDEYCRAVPYKLIPYVF